MIRLLLALIFMTLALPAFAQGAGGGGGTDRPSRSVEVPEDWRDKDFGDLTPVQLLIMEENRRKFCSATPERCRLETGDSYRIKKKRGHCGDVYETVEEAFRYCPGSSQIMKMFLRSQFTCHCYNI